MDLIVGKAPMAFLLHLFGVRYIFHIVLVPHQLQSWLDFHELLLHQYVTRKNALKCKSQSAGQNQENTDLSLLSQTFRAAFAKQ